MDFLSLKRNNRAFRSAFRELQRTGWYYGHGDCYLNGLCLLQRAEQGHFFVTDGPCHKQ